MTPGQALRITTLRGSTTHEAHAAAEDLEAYYRTKAGRVTAGQVTAERRHEQMRDRILQAVGTLDPAMQGFVAVVQTRIGRNLAFYGFEAVPDQRTVRKVQAFLLNRGAVRPPTGHDESSCTRKSS